MTQITFYILQNSGQPLGQPLSQVSEQDALLLFVCRLCQAMLDKSEHSVVLDDNVSRLERLDEWLWSFAPTSFMPHDGFVESSIEQFLASVAPIRLLNNASWLSASDAKMPWNGVVINLSATPLTLPNAVASQAVTNKDGLADESAVCAPSCLLEIIAGNEADKEIGRTKYRHYQRQGHQPKHHVLSLYPNK